MHWIDQFAYNNRIHKLDPAYKTGFSLSMIFLCLAIPIPWVSLTLMIMVVSLTVFWAGLPSKFIFKLLIAEGSFLVFGVLGVAVSITTRSSSGAISAGPFWLNITSDSINMAFKLLARSLGCTAAMNFLALTTPMVDLIDLFRRIHIPDLLIDLLTLIYRFIFTLMDCLDRMMLAQEVRLGFNGWGGTLRSAGEIAANLFIEAFRRSQKLDIALQGRGWDGSLRVLPQEYEPLFHSRCAEKENSHAD